LVAQVGRQRAHKKGAGAQFLDLSHAYGPIANFGTKTDWCSGPLIFVYLNWEGRTLLKLDRDSDPEGYLRLRPFSKEEADQSVRERRSSRELCKEK
jgi:hypothetical protein